MQPRFLVKQVQSSSCKVNQEQTPSIDSRTCSNMDTFQIKCQTAPGAAEAEAACNDQSPAVPVSGGKRASELPVSLYTMTSLS